MTEWNTHNCELLPLETQRELAQEFAEADRRLEAKSMAARRLSNLERRTTALEQNTASKALLKKEIDSTLRVTGRFMGDRMRELEARVTGKATVRDRGVWKSHETYLPGEGATDHGSFWICRETTASRPGTDGTWRLAAKGGRGAKP